MSGDGVLLTVRLTAEIATDATLESIAGFLGVPASSMDQDYGVIPLTAGNEVVSIIMSASAFENMPDTAKKHVEGPFSNPKIAPFSPLE